METKTVSKNQLSTQTLYRIVFEVNYEEWSKLRELVHYYGMGNFPDTIRLAINEAFERIGIDDEIEDETQVEIGDETMDETEDETGNETMDETMDETRNETMDETETEEAPTLEDETLEFAKGLDPEGRKFLTQQLSTPYNSRSGYIRHLGGLRSPLEDKIINFVNSATGFDGSRSTVDSSNATRRNLLGFLKVQGILTKVK